jgi:site-specific DNA-methyltransferase (adenine-specific)
MGRDWDDFEPKEYQEWCEQWAKEVKRVLKPGGHLLAFSGNRTHHRLFTGVEDAGFEIRDTLTWHYGSGFPKASDISKTIDKREDAEREIVGKKTAPDGKALDERVSHSGEEYDESSADYDDCKRDTYIREPATEQAKKWDGWKTGLKPATEYVVMARKPFENATVDCVLEHGTGALNIDGARIDTSESWSGAGTHNSPKQAPDGVSFGSECGTINNKKRSSSHQNGRYPSNVVFDNREAERLDSKHPTTKASDGDGGGEGGIWSESVDGQPVSEQYGDKGGPSRYFYTSKATKSERTLDGKIDNSHPTVKPQDLMEWLVKLVTAENQIVLDPFCGSGTTCKAAKELNRQFIGIEKQAKWADVARVRVGLTPDDPSIVRDDDNQEGLEAYE